jgi:hypothetical protein
MNIDNILKKVFIFFLTITLLLSTYFCVVVKFLGEKKFNDVYTDWQTPMLLALYLEITYTNVFDTFKIIF